MGEFLNNKSSMTYVDYLTASMGYLANEHDYIFIGQGAECGGHGMAPTLELVPNLNRYEMPVFEETQTGLALGMALQGLNIVSMYPRFDFFISGANQLINHADKLKQMSNERFKPNLIYRVGVGSKFPIDAGPQHTNDYSEEFSNLLVSIPVIKLDKKDSIKECFQNAAMNGGIYLFVEYYEHYGN